MQNVDLHMNQYIKKIFDQKYDIIYIISNVVA
jgi:hypothetical protein